MGTRDRNVLGGRLAACCHNPTTGFFRDGFCHTGPEDINSHVVCAQMTEAFLQFSMAQGNDLITPQLENDFPGLQPGDFWCLCVFRWLEAYEHDVAPPVCLESTHEDALQHISLDMLKERIAKKTESESGGAPVGETLH